MKHLTLILLLAAMTSASQAQTSQPYISLKGKINVLWGFQIKANVTIATEEPLTGSFTYRTDHGEGSGTFTCGNAIETPNFREYSCETKRLNASTQVLEDYANFIVHRTSEDTFHLYKLSSRSEAIAERVKPTASLELNFE